MEICLTLLARDRQRGEEFLESGLVKWSLWQRKAIVFKVPQNWCAWQVFLHHNVLQNICWWLSNYPLIAFFRHILIRHIIFQAKLTFFNFDPCSWSLVKKKFQDSRSVEIKARRRSNSFARHYCAQQHTCVIWTVLIHPGAVSKRDHFCVWLSCSTKA